jgi:hypothetical protein
MRVAKPPPCLCGLSHWSTEREKCKFFERAPDPVAQPHARVAKAKGETKNQVRQKIAEADPVLADQNPIKKSRGRPKSIAAKPWEALGLSRAAYYRRNKKVNDHAAPQG